MKKNIFINFSLVATLAVVGCAQDKSDPIKDYRGLKTTQARTQGDTSQGVQENPFIVELPDTIPDFIEGQPNSIQVRVRSRDPGITFSLAVNQVDLPKGATWDKVKDESPQSQLWVLKWTPPLRYTGLTESTAPISIPMQARVETAANPNYRPNSVYPVTINTVVRKSSTVPSVKFIGLQPSTTEGKSFSFTVEVTDPASSNGMQPKITKFGCPQVNGEQPIEDGYNQVVENGGVTSKGNGVWSYQYIFDTKNHTVISRVPKATRTSLCFGFNVTSAATTNSYNPQRTVEVILSSKVPTIDWSDAPPALLVGKMNTLTFKVKTSSDRGEITVQNITPGFQPNPGVALPGAPDMSCDKAAGDTNIKVCTIHWQMDCDAKNLKSLKDKYTLSMVATNTVEGAKPETAKVTKEFAVQKSSESCDPTKVTPPPASTPSTSKKKMVAAVPKGEKP